MIALVFAMLWSRRGRAATVALLAALATACAVAAPRYVAAVDDRIVRTELATADPSERTMLISGEVQSAGGGSMSRTFQSLAEGWLDPPGFVTVFSAQFPAQPADLEQATASQLSTVVYREGLCEHVTVVAGRCLMGVGDTVLTPGAARRLGLRPGDAVSLAGSRFDTITNRYSPAGGPTALTVVGIVEARDGTEPYWGRAGGDRDAFQVDRRTLDTFARPSELQSFDAYPGPGAVSVATLPALRAWAEEAEERSSDDAKLNTDLASLLDRIDERRGQVREIVPFAVAPVLVLAWAVIVLAAATVVRARRFEHGVVALRGAGRLTRWSLAAGETTISVLAGAVAGFTAAGGWQTPGAALYAGVAVLGALLAAIVVALRTVAAPVPVLLRQVDRRTARWRGFAFEGAVAVAACVAVLQVRDRAGGVALLAPALVLLAVGLVAGRVVPVLSGLTARRALRRGGPLAGVLAGLRLSRRPAGARLLALLTVALGSLGFAAAATTAVDRDQLAEARLRTGAPVVLTVDAPSRTALLRAVRAADPGGRSAMAVVPVPSATQGQPPALAVDAERLPAVALWAFPDARASLTDLAARLHPPRTAPPVTLTGDTFGFDITVTRLDRPDVQLSVTVAPLDGRPTGTVDLGLLRPGRAVYSAPSPECAAGCRLVELTAKLPPYVGPAVELTLHAPPATAWRLPPGATAETTADGGVRFTLPATSRTDAGSLRPAGGPERLPVVSTLPLPTDGTFQTFNHRPVPAELIVEARQVPRLGTRGGLMDLEYADLFATDGGRAEGAEVWLAADAPPALIDRLRAEGLTVTQRRTVEDTRAGLAAGGTALGLRFYLLAGAMSVALGAAGLVVAALVPRGGDLPALRTQGLRGSTARLVEPLVVLVLVGCAAVAGLLAAAVAWSGVAASIPGLAGDGAPPVPAPVLTVAAAAAVLAVVGLGTTVRRR